MSPSRQGLIVPRGLRAANRLVLLRYVTQLRRKGLERGRAGIRQDNKDTMASPLGVR